MHLKLHGYLHHLHVHNSAKLKKKKVIRIFLLAAELSKQNAFCFRCAALFL